MPSFKVSDRMAHVEELPVEHRAHRAEAVGQVASLGRFLILGILGWACFVLTACKTRDGQDQTVGDAFQEYLREHSSPGWKAGHGWYAQVGRVDFYGPFPIEILTVNRAFPASEHDANRIAESFIPSMAHATVYPDGRVVYPQVAQTLRSVRIMHTIRCLGDNVPKPTWIGNVMHERTEILAQQNAYLEEFDGSVHYQYPSSHSDGPSYRREVGADQYGRMPYRGEHQ